MTHVLEPGYPMLETELSEQLGMSRTPVREAVNRLKAEGLIESVSRKGIFVKALTREDVKNCYEIAEGLEGMVAYLATTESDPSQIGELGRCVERMEEAILEDDTDEWISADEQFHRVLYSLCGNKRLVQELHRLNTQIQLSRLTITARRLTNMVESTEDHRLMFDAIASGDAEQAREITQRHWRRTRKRILSVLDK